MTERALQGASVAAIVGTTATGILTPSATALPVSMTFPPPAQTTMSQWPAVAIDFSLSISGSQHSPLKGSKRAATPSASRLFPIPSRAAAMADLPAVTRAFFPSRLTCGPISVMTPGPCT